MSGLHETDADEPVGVSRLDGGGDRVVVGDLGGVGGAIGGETPDAPQRPEERFLAGRVIARQPATGYRAALDTVLLGAAVGLRPGEAGLELGCGSGAALLIAAERSPGAAFTGLERAPDLAALAAANAAANSSADRVRILEGDVFAPPPDWRGRFDHVFFNPPYFDDAGAVRPPKDPGRRAAFVNDVGDAGDWLRAALGLTRSRGHVTVIHRADRLGALLAALENAAGEVRVRAVHPRSDAPARRVVVRARKGVRSPLSVLPPLILHGPDGALNPAAAAILSGEDRFTL